MASIQTRKRDNTLIIGFYNKGARCREQTALTDNAAKCGNITRNGQYRFHLSQRPEFRHNTCVVVLNSAICIHNFGFK